MERRIVACACAPVHYARDVTHDACSVNVGMKPVLTLLGTSVRHEAGFLFHLDAVHCEPRAAPSPRCWVCRRHRKKSLINLCAIDHLVSSLRSRFTLDARVNWFLCTEAGSDAFGVKLA